MKQRVRRRLGSSPSDSATSTGAPETPPTKDGVLQCVPENNGGLFGNLNI